MTLIFSLMFAGCASVQAPGYISRNDHAYERKIYAGFEKVTSSFVYVLKQRGWTIEEESLPSMYERDERYDNSGYQNLLIITDPKRNFRIVSTTTGRMNIFIHGISNTCDVEVRYQATTPMIKNFTSVRNDKLVNGILDAVEADAGR